MKLNGLVSKTKGCIVLGIAIAGIVAFASMSEPASKPFVGIQENNLSAPDTKNGSAKRDA